jgi:hypothetical protein
MVEDHTCMRLAVIDEDVVDGEGEALGDALGDDFEHEPDGSALKSGVRR